MTILSNRLFAAAVFALAAFIFMAAKDQQTTIAATDRPANPLLSEWSGPYGGAPPFDKVKISDFKPALEAAMKENLAEIDAIANSTEPPTFENTIVALERTGKTLDRVATIYYLWAGNMSSDEFEPVQTEMEPLLAAHGDKITQNEKLFKRIETVYNTEHKTTGDKGERGRLTWLDYTNFVRQGAKLDSAGKARLAQINQDLAGLFTKFNQNLLGDEGQLYLTITNKDDLAGLPQSLVDGAAQAAAAKKVSNSWVIRNTRSSIEPFLTYADNRVMREKAWRMFVDRGDNGDARDNNSVIKQILKLRAERARLLGYPAHPNWRLENSMAKTPETATKLMEGVWPAAVARVHEEVADMQKLADKDAKGIKIEPWDYRYYMEKVRKDKYDLDQNDIKPYLQLDKMREAMFWVAGELFGYAFTPVKDVPVFHPDVTVYEVKDKASGRHVGLWFFDPYARDGKRSGAWMNAYRSQDKLDGGTATIVSNNANFVKTKPGEPVLISWDDAITMFHEFGHALHGLSSDVTYPSLAGTNVARDYVEFPSQLMEHWLSTPEVLQKYALHYQTGKPIPQELVAKIKKTATFNQGFSTVEYLSSALVDMKLHLADTANIDPDKFERETLAQIGMPHEIVMRHRLPQFGHLFSGDSYSAGYYSYLWSDVLTADAFEAFTEGKGPYDKAVAARLYKYIFSVGNTVDPADAYRSFRGRDPNVDALMRKRGFPVTKK
jgi:peptidyl-dipeptidase Dcp